MARCVGSVGIAAPSVTLQVGEFVRECCVAARIMIAMATFIAIVLYQRRVAATATPHPASSTTLPASTSESDIHQTCP